MSVSKLFFMKYIVAELPKKVLQLYNEVVFYDNMLSIKWFYDNNNKKSWDMGHLLNKPDNSGDRQRVTHS